MSLQNPLGLETVAALRKVDGLSILQTPRTVGGLVTVKTEPSVNGLSIDDLDRRRKRSGISLARLLGEARVDRRTWRDAKRGTARVRVSTLERVDRALLRLVTGERVVTEGSLTGWYRYIVGDIARQVGVDIAAAQAIACDFSAEKPQNPEWIAAARVRRLAIYTLACAFGQRNADVARAAGCTRQGVGKAIAEIEALRELDKVVDQLLTRCAGLVKP